MATETLGARAVPIAAVLLAVALPIAGAQARVTQVRIDRVEPFAAGATFGAVGAYERVIGVARGELDPTDPRNAGIVDIQRAPRDANGKVAYETDIFVLRPAISARGNHHLLFEVLNRGRKLMINSLDEIEARAATNDPNSVAEAGDGLLFRLGYTMAWAGWDPDAPTARHGMTAHIPALPDVTGETTDEFVSATRGPPMTAFHLSYTAAVTDQSAARLTMRRREADPEAVIPPTGWRFVDARTVTLLPEGSKPTPGTIYELTYRARAPWVSGMGFAIQRDVVAFLRSNAPDDRGTANPAGGGISAAIGFGISQSGRFLRDFIEHGFNQDETGHIVFDGVLSHIAGIGTVFLNAEFAQPFRTRTQHQDHRMPENAFPFSAATTQDPVSGRSGSVLRHDGFDPRLIETNTDAEYWQKGASLLSTDPLGQHDVALPPDTRVFLIAGTQHTGHHGATDAAGPCINLRNPHDPYPALRALLVDLDIWITEGTPPPASRIPHLADGTLTDAASLGFPSLPGFAVATAPDNVDPQHHADESSPYRPLVPAVDADGNDRAGLKLPDIAVPLGTYTGFNLYKDPFPTGELCDRDGSFLPFARTANDGAGDPRQSLAARYGSHQHYVALVATAAQRLVAARLLLPEDAQRYVAAAQSVTGF